MAKNTEVQPDASQRAADKADSGRKESASKKPGLMERISSFKEFVILARNELRKVSWPTLKETRKTSLVVLGFVAVMAILLGLVDLILSGIVRFILY